MRKLFQASLVTFLLMPSVGTASAFEVECLIEWVGNTSPEDGQPSPQVNIRLGQVFSVDIQTGEISGDGSVWLNPILVGSGLKTSDGPRPKMFFFGQDLIDDPVFMVLETWRIEKRKPFLVYDSGLYYSGVCVTQD